MTMYPWYKEIHCGSPRPCSPFFTNVPTNPSFTENLSTEQLLLSVTSRWPHPSVTPLVQIFLSTPGSLPSTRQISSSVLMLIAQTPPEPEVVKRTPVDPCWTKHMSVTLSWKITKALERRSLELKKIPHCLMCNFISIELQLINNFMKVLRLLKQSQWPVLTF